MSSLRRSALLLFALTGCGGAPAESPTPALAPGPAPPPAAATSPPDDEAAQAGADAVVARALDVVSRLRELPAKGPVNGKTIDRKAMVEHVKRQIRTEIPPEVVLAQTEMLFALGTVDQKFDYEASLLALMTSQLAGFYEPKDRTMYLAADLGEVERGATLAHELVHALQDQHYDLGRHVKYRPDATDEQSAVHALAEGDATSAMLDQMLAARGMRAIDLNDDLIGVEARGAIDVAVNTTQVPGIVKRSIVSPYVDGVMFVHWARRRSGWAGVDDAWRALPKSTEQILHPEKLIANELPERVAVPIASAVGPKSALYHDVLGEQSLRLVFEEWMPRRAAVAAASDWGGDRVAVFRDGDLVAVAWHVRYDTAGASQRGLEAFARGVLRDDSAAGDAPVIPPAHAVAATRSGQLCRERPERGPFALLRRVRSVVVIAGPYRRGAAGVTSAGTCREALSWARAVAAQR
jgi:hypothetical protein